MIPWLLFFSIWFAWGVKKPEAREWILVGEAFATGLILILLLYVSV